VPTAPLPSGTFQIQLASVPSEDAAQAEWKRVNGRHKDLLAALTPAITKADLGERGVYYRLRAGPLADKAAADELCASLAADKVGCIVIKP
jgi:cell division septation protein DedD